MSVTPDSVLVSLHDVCPASWELYRPLVEALDRLPDVRLTLLVVPDFHGGGSLERDTGFRRAMDERLARGDELVLHGLRHRDEGPAPKTPAEFLRRRILTHEGEFSSLSETESAERIAAGRELFRRLDWPVTGFVPPGWMTNAASRRAIADAGFDYSTDHRAFYRLPDWHAWPLPTAVMSSRSAWRRLAFEWLNRGRLARYRQAPVLRLALHPVDMRYSRPMTFWLDTIRAQTSQRRSLTKAQWLAQQVVGVAA